VLPVSFHELRKSFLDPAEVDLNGCGRSDDRNISSRIELVGTISQKNANTEDRPW